MLPVLRSRCSGSAYPHDSGTSSGVHDDDELVEVTPTSIRIRKRHRRKTIVVAPTAHRKTINFAFSHKKPAIAGRFFFTCRERTPCEYLPYKSVITSIESFVTITAKSYTVNCFLFWRKRKMLHWFKPKGLNNGGESIHRRKCKEKLDRWLKDGITTPGGKLP